MRHPTAPTTPDRSGSIAAGGGQHPFAPRAQTPPSPPTPPPPPPPPGGVLFPPGGGRPAATACFPSLHTAGANNNNGGGGGRGERGLRHRPPRRHPGSRGSTAIRTAAMRSSRGAVAERCQWRRQQWQQQQQQQQQRGGSGTQTAVREMGVTGALSKWCHDARRGRTCTHAGRPVLVIINTFPP